MFPKDCPLLKGTDILQVLSFPRTNVSLVTRRDRVSKTRFLISIEDFPEGPPGLLKSLQAQLKFSQQLNDNSILSGTNTPEQGQGTMARCGECSNYKTFCSERHITQNRGM